MAATGTVKGYNYSLFKRLTKLSTNNFKLDITVISDPLEMCKSIISECIILIHQPIRNFTPYCHKTGSRSITLVLP